MALDEIYRVQKGQGLCLTCHTSQFGVEVLSGLKKDICSVVEGDNNIIHRGMCFLLNY